MKIVLDNAQHTPHLDFLDGSGRILGQLFQCSDGLKATGDLWAFFAAHLKSDGVVLYEKKSG